MLTIVTALSKGVFRIFFQKHIFIFVILPVLIVTAIFSILYFKGYETSINQVLSFADTQKDLRSQINNAKKQYDDLTKQYEDLKNQDQVKINVDLKKEIENIQNTYKKSVSLYEQLTDLKSSGGKTDEISKIFALALNTTN